ncbi:MAG: VIT1/CCC1 transporter family protein [Pseudomonadota bacterium]
MTEPRDAPPPPEHSHEDGAIAARLAEGARPDYLRDWVYGGIDGAVTTFAIVAGATGGALSERVVIILGVANLVADGLSMAAGNYLGTKAEADNRRRLRAVEERHVALHPEGERREIREIFRRKGFDGEDLERAVAVITRDRELWIETMLAEEYGLPAAARSPMRAALSTFGAFLLCGAAPILPFLLGLDQAWGVSIALTGVVFYAIGSAKSAWSPQPAWRSGLEVLSIGAAAALAAYGLGAAADALL